MHGPAPRSLLLNAAAALLLLGAGAPAGAGTSAGAQVQPGQLLLRPAVSAAVRVQVGGRHGGWHGHRGYYGHRGHHGHFRHGPRWGLGLLWVAPPLVWAATPWPEPAPPYVPAAPPAVSVAPTRPDPTISARRGQDAQQTEYDRQQCNRWAMTQPAAVADAEVFHQTAIDCMERLGYRVD